MNEIESKNSANHIGSDIVALKTNLETLSTELEYLKAPIEFKHYSGLIRNHKQLVKMRVKGTLLYEENYNMPLNTIGNSIHLEILTNKGIGTSPLSVTSPVTVVLGENYEKDDGIGTSPVTVVLGENYENYGIGRAPGVIVPIRPDMICDPLIQTSEVWKFHSSASPRFGDLEYKEEFEFTVSAETFKGCFLWKRYKRGYFSSCLTFYVRVEPTWETIG